MATQLPTSAEVINASQTNAEQKVDFAAMLDFLADHLAEGVTSGTSTAYTLTPVPAIAAYAVGQLFNITLHTDAGNAPTINISGLGATVNLVYRNAAGSYVNINGLPAGVYRGVMVSTTQMLLNAPIGLLQRVVLQTSAGVSGLTRFPVTAAAPTNVQGDQFLSQALTAKSANSRITVEVEMAYSANTTGNVGFAIFRDGVLQRAATAYYGVANVVSNINFNYDISAGDLAAHTYTVRAGLDPAGFSFNFNTPALLGGFVTSSLTLEEFLS